MDFLLFVFISRTPSTLMLLAKSFPDPHPAATLNCEIEALTCEVDKLQLIER